MKFVARIHIYSRGSTLDVAFICLARPGVAARDLQIRRAGKLRAQTARTPTLQQRSLRLHASRGSVTEIAAT